MLDHRDFRDALPGHQPEKARIPLVMDSLHKDSRIGSVNLQSRRAENNHFRA
jgi:hypothetical protein